MLSRMLACGLLWVGCARAEPPAPVRAHAEPLAPVRAHAEPRAPVRMHAEPTSPAREHAEPAASVRAHAEPAAPAREHAEPAAPAREHAQEAAARAQALGGTRPEGAPGAAVKGDCPLEMVSVPPGTFMMGTKKDDPIAPLHKVTLTQPYCLDRLETTLEEYQRCEQAGVCTKSGAPRKGLDGGGFYCNEKREGRGKHPINCITWLQADAYCRWREKRLPTEAEWEFAARGPKSFKWPWGNRPPTEERAWNSMYQIVNRDHAKCADMGPEICPKILDHAPMGTTEVGRFPAGASPFGALDMGGNVAEWVQDWEYAIPWTEVKDVRDAVDPTGPNLGSKRVIKDMGWDAGNQVDTIGDRVGGWPDKDVYDTVGVRCALSLIPR